MWLFRSGLVLAAYIGINIYAGIRLLGLVRFFLPSFRLIAFWPIYLMLSFSYVIVFFLRIDRIQPFRNAAMLSLPALAYFFMALATLDLVRLSLYFFKLIPKSAAYSAAGAGIALGFAFLMLIFGSINARYVRPTHYNISIGKKAGVETLRIALISDLHVGSAVDRKWLARIVDAANRAEPDIICLAGDIFDNNVSTMADPEGIAGEFRRFVAPLGVFACQGNHDVDRLSLRAEASTSGTAGFLRKAGVSFMEDEYVLLPGGFYMAGRRDARPIGARQGRKPVGELLAGLDLSLPLILLDHQPVDFPVEEAAGADLILSGHTHAGQFFPGSIITAAMYKKAGAVHYGYWKGKTAQGVVSSGAGVWGPAFRVGTRSEVAILEIKFGQQPY